MTLENLIKIKERFGEPFVTPLVLDYLKELDKTYFHNINYEQKKAIAVCRVKNKLLQKYGYKK